MATEYIHNKNNHNNQKRSTNEPTKNILKLSTETQGSKGIRQWPIN